MATREKSCRSPGKNRPYIINHAMGMIDFDSALDELSRSARVILKYIVSLADAKDASKPSWAKKGKIAENTGYGIATVYRVLNELEEDNFIVRLGQQRRANTGRLANGLIRLTAHACELLGLPCNPDVAALDKQAFARKEENSRKQAPVAKYRLAAPYARLRKMIGGHIKQPRLCLSKYSLSRDNRKEAPIQVRYGFTRIGHSRVPSELVWMITSEKLSIPQVFGLMREAGNHGKRLSQIVEVCRSRILEIDGNRLYAYIRALCRCDTDFSAVTKVREAKQRKEVEKTDASAAIERFAVIHGGKVFQGKDGRYFRLRVLSTARMVQVIRDPSDVDGMGNAPLDIAFMDAVKDGRLKPCHAN